MDGAITVEARRGGDAARLPLGLAGSIALHAGLLLALLVLTPVRSFIAPEPQAISVDLIPYSAFEQVPEPEHATTLPEQVVSPEPAAPASTDAPGDVAPAPAPVAGAPVQDADGTYRATKLYAAALLNQPEMAQVRRGLPTLASSERVTQLCNIEALEQIRLAAPQYDPDTMVSYAMADPVSSGLMLTAMGGAFRSRRQWYNVSFQCTASPGLDGVDNFSFKLGELIPDSEWEAHYLNAEDKAE